MTAREQLLQEIQHSPEPLIKEVLDFLLFARIRNYPFVEPEVGDRQTPQQPIWEFAQELMQDAPPEELAKLPTAQHQELTLNDLISTIPNNFTYPDDVREFTESEPLGRELPEIDWAAKWEKWFTECETMPISTTTQPPQNDYTALLIDKYREQGLEL